MPGPYGLPQMGCAREGQGRSAARPFAVGGGCPETGGDAKPVGTPQAASAASPFDKGASLSPLRGFGGTPEFQIGAEGAGVKNEK